MLGYYRNMKRAIECVAVTDASQPLTPGADRIDFVFYTELRVSHLLDRK